MKVCKKCGERKNKSEFHKHSNKRDGLQIICKKCTQSYGREWYQKNKRRSNEQSKRWRERNPEKNKEYYENWKAKNPERVKRIRRSHKLRSQYGLTIEEYTSMVAAQGGVCACCQKAPSEGSNLYVDHCHKNGTVRGLLCKLCNLGIGALGDDLTGALNAVRYLSQSKS